MKWIRALPPAWRIEPAADRRLPGSWLGSDWLRQTTPRLEPGVDTLIPEDWPDLGTILDLMDL